jgi:hypothetical protein
MLRARGWHLLLLRRRPLRVTWLVTTTARSYRCDSCLSRAASASIDLARAAYPAARSTLPATACDRGCNRVTAGAAGCGRGCHRVQLVAAGPGQALRRPFASRVRALHRRRQTPAHSRNPVPLHGGGQHRGGVARTVRVVGRVIRSEDCGDRVDDDELPEESSGRVSSRGRMHSSAMACGAMAVVARDAG